MNTRFLTTPAGQHRWLRLGLVVTALAVAVSETQVNGQNAGFKIVKPAPGGIDPHPYVTSITTTQGVHLEWTGVQAPYQVQKQTTLNGPWQDVGKPIDGNSVDLPAAALSGAVFHRVAGATPQYQGVGNCAECHGIKVDSWSKTAHGRAYATLQRVGQQNNPECVVCHTVGASAPGGFVSESTTDQFKNVQCENCHGPAGDHLNSGDPPTVFPIVTKSAMLCGGCHSGEKHPNYEDWSGSPHAGVVMDAVSAMASTNLVTAIGRMGTCGTCHSGATRLAMVRAFNAYTGNARTNVTWPSGIVATNTGITCAVCHDPHEEHVWKNPIDGTTYTNQMRNPLVSTNFFSYNTGTNFAVQYDPSINLCGQCHNSRGASVTATRGPHYSGQYNMLVGTVGVITNTIPIQGAHRTNTLQCVSCHMHEIEPENPTAANPVVTGHGFKPTLEACAVCHKDTAGPGAPANRLANTQAEIKSRIAAIKVLMDKWATTKNTNSWASKYGALGWEFTSPGEISNPNSITGVVGPSTAEQAQIPQAIYEARYNLYLIVRDKSFGIHNPPHVRNLLNVAEGRVSAELAKP